MPATPCLLVGLVALLQGAAGEPARDPFLDLGIRQHRDGSFEEAVFSLDTAVRRLSDKRDRSGQLPVAYLYLGAAYVGLEHEGAAQGKFREALKLDPQIRPAPEEFPARVVEVFEIERLRRTAAAKRRATRIFLLAGGMGAGAAVGVAASNRQTARPGNRPPLAAIGVQPEGQAIVGVTTLEFTGSASDPDADAVSFAWDFGDGTRATGPVASHRYTNEADHQVALSVDDGHGETTRVSQAVTVRSVGGPWRSAGQPQYPFNCTQALTAFRCQIAITPPAGFNNFTAVEVQLIDPRRAEGVLFRFQERTPVNCQFSNDLQLFDCTDAGGIFTRFVREQ